MTGGSPPRQSWSVRVRIVAAILAVAALGLAVAGGTAYLVERAQTLRGIDEALLDRVEAARAVALAYVPEGAAPEGDPPAGAPDGETGQGSAEGEEAVAPPSPEDTASTTQEVLHAIFRSVIPRSGESAIGLIDGRAAVIPGVALDFELHRETAFLAEVAAQAAEGSSVALGVAHLSSRSIRYVVVPVEVQGDPARGSYVAAVDMDAALAVIEATFQVYAVAAAVTLVAIGLVGWFVAGRLLRPLRSLRSAALRIADTRSVERIPVSGRDDVSELTRAVNEMLDRLAESAEGQRRLLDDVRHELKTPITIVRGHLELLDSGRSGDIEATRALALDELDRMAGLVDGLELLAEAQRELISAEPVDVAGLTREVHAKAAAIPGRRWSLGEVAEAVAVLDRSRITQAWLQLCDNAAKFSPEGSEVRLGSSLGEGVVELWVQDEGPGIPADAKERIFERFGRAHPGRGIRGSGLGLPIVRAIAEAHGGRVTVASGLTGSLFALELPLAASSAPAPEAAAPVEEAVR